MPCCPQWIKRGDLFTQQITVNPGRAYLLSVGQAHMTSEWAEHYGRKRLHYTKPGSAPGRARLNCIV